MVDNVTVHSQDSAAFTPPPISGDPTGNLNAALTAVTQKNADTTYYNDTTATSSNTQTAVVHSKAMLANIPAPNAQVSGAGASAATNVSGTSGTGNPFLSPGCLTAFFMAMNEMADTLIKSDVISIQVVAQQMSLLNELAKDQASQIMNSAQAESNTYMASAITAFVQAGASGAMAVVQFTAQRGADKQMKEEQEKLETKSTDAESKLTEAKKELGELDGPLGNAQKDVMDAETSLEKCQKNVKDCEAELAQINKKKGDTTEAQANLDQAKADEQAAVKDLKDKKDILKDAWGKSTPKEIDQYKDAKHKVDIADINNNDAKKELQKFKDNYFTNRSTEIQNRTQLGESFIKALSQLGEGAMNVWKAQLAMEKGRSDALNAELQVYIQNVSKTIDQLNSMRDSNSKLIEQLMQFLQQTSNTYAQSFNKLTAA